jgi:hypothetical protein
VNSSLLVHKKRANHPWEVRNTFFHLEAHQGREIIAMVPLENGAFCTIFSENFHKF